MWLTRFAIARPVIVAMFFIGLAVFGTISYKSMGISLFPNVQFPIVLVTSTYPGASPSEMEKLVVKPIEDEIDGIANLDKLTAVAQEDRMFILVQFKLDTDLDIAGIDVQHRVDNARVNMPNDINPPYVTSNAGSTASDPIIVEAVSSPSLSREKVSDLVKDRIVPELKRVPGVDSADLRGEVLREIHVYPDAKRMFGTGVTLADLYQTLAANNSNLPGGRIDQPTQEITVSVHADVVQPADILSIPLLGSSFGALISQQQSGGNSPGGLTVGHVASVEDGHVEQRIISHYNGNPTIIMDITRQATADELKTTDAVRAKFEELKKKYAQIRFTEIDNNADYTRASVDGVLENLGEGIFLTAIVMLLFLHAWRNALVVMIAIPASLLATFIVMHVMGFTVDLISLMGLGLTIGILVDDSIVVLENITRHRDMGENAMDAAVNGRTEIGLAAITITLVDVVVFLPIAFLSGIVGKYMKEFGIVIVVATLFSLFVSFTLTPLLAARWAVKERSKAPPRYLAWFQVGFERLLTWYRHKALPWALAHPKYVVAMCFVLVANSLMFPAADVKAQLAIIDVGFAGLTILGLLLGATLLRGLKARKHAWAKLPHNGFAKVLVFVIGNPLMLLVGIPKAINNGFVNARQHPRMALLAAATFVAIGAVTYFIGPIGSEFIPNSETGIVRGTIKYPVGTPLAVTAAGVDRLEQELVKIPNVESVTTSAGVMPSGFGSTIAGNVGRFTFTMNKNHRREAPAALEKIRKMDWTVPGAEFVAFHEGGGGGGGGAIFYTLSGPDATLNDGAEKLAKFIRAQKGTINVQTGAENEAPRMNIHIDPKRAALLGVLPGDAATAARIAIGGVVATKVRTPTNLVDVRLELPANQRSSFEQIRQIKLRSATTGAIYNLQDVATFDMTKAPTKIERLNRERVVRVTGDIDDTKGKVTLGDVLAPVQKALDTPGFLPPGTRAIAQGDSELFNQTFQSMGLALVTSFALVYMLMVILYGSFVEPFVIMFSVPVAMVGAFAGLALRGQTLNLFSMIAIIMLFGLVAKNGILLVDYANTMRKRGQTVFEAMLTAAHTRFRPILMTTCAMVFGMFPLATGLVEGAEERASMGTVLIGGLLSSLILTLFLVPIMYNTIMGRAERREAARESTVREGEETRVPGLGAPVGAPGD